MWYDEQSLRSVSSASEQREYDLRVDKATILVVTSSPTFLYSLEDHKAQKQMKKPKVVT